MNAPPPLLTARAWHTSLLGRNDATSTRAAPYRVIRFDDTPLELAQPALLDDVVCLHLGGAKRVVRSYAGRTTVHDVPENAFTLMPRRQENRWRTEGPNEYVHFVISPKTLDEMVVTEFERSRDQFELHDHVGLSHPLLTHLGHELIRLYDSAEKGRLYREGIFTAFVLTLLRSYSSLGNGRMDRGARAVENSGGFPAWRLRKVLDFLHSHHAQDVGYAELAEIAGVSRSHFFRAFRTSTGTTPGQYLEQLRVSIARTALERRKSIDEAAQEGGFESSRSMSRAFVRRFGITPSQYRRWYG